MFVSWMLSAIHDVTHANMAHIRRGAARRTATCLTEAFPWWVRKRSLLGQRPACGCLPGPPPAGFQAWWWRLRHNAEQETPRRTSLSLSLSHSLGLCFPLLSSRIQAKASSMKYSAKKFCFTMYLFEISVRVYTHSAIGKLDFWVMSSSCLAALHRQKDVCNVRQRCDIHQQDRIDDASYPSALTHCRMTQADLLRGPGRTIPSIMKESHLMKAFVLPQRDRATMGPCSAGHSFLEHFASQEFVIVH